MMTEKQRMYEMFAELLAYPAARQDCRFPSTFSGRGSSERDDRILDSGLESQSDVGSHLSEFASATAGLSPTDLEELYTRTFDINPISSLEIGWHLYGEAYERGAFLVKMREMLRRYDVQESAELPDHLVHVLHLLSRMDGDEADAFIRTYLLPALKKMLDGFSKQSSPYEHVLRALFTAIEQRQAEGVHNV